jgi:hypothetical protein
MISEITYGICKEIYFLGDHRRISYGIVIYSNVTNDETATIIASRHDVTAQYGAMKKLVDECNNLKLSMLQLDDVLEDYFYSIT